MQPGTHRFIYLYTLVFPEIDVFDKFKENLFLSLVATFSNVRFAYFKIGRASCRERV